MATKAKKEFSLADLDVVKASETPFEFEYLNTNGEPTGVKLSVLGGQSDTVRELAAELLNSRRQKEAARAAVQARSGRNNAIPAIDKVEEDMEFGQRLAAVRLVGWTGIKEPWTPENALALCKSNAHLAAQVMDHSDDLANFTKA